MTCPLCCRLIKDGAATEQELKDIRAAVQADYDKAFEESKTWEPSKDEWLSSKWAGFKSPGQVGGMKQTQRVRFGTYSKVRPHVHLTPLVV